MWKKLEKSAEKCFEAGGEDTMEINSNFINCLEIENVEFKSMLLSSE